MAKTKLPPVHPGEVLLEEFLKPMNLSQNRLALDIGVPARRINEIVLGKRSVSVDTALRLAATLVLRLSCGWAFRWTMTSMWQQTRWGLI